MRFNTTTTFKRYVLPGAIIIIVVSSLWLISKDSLPEGLIQVNGRLEGDRITVSTEYSGKIWKLDAKEGDLVEAGQIMARLDNERLQKQFSQAKDAFEVLQKQVRADEANLRIQKKEMPLTIGQAEAGVLQASAALEKAEAKEKKALRDAKRARELRPSGAVSEDYLEKVELLLDTAGRDAAIARASLNQAQAALTSAELEGERILAQQSRLEALYAERDKAQNAVEEIRCVLDKYIIRAPASGTVTAKLVSLGETLAQGSPLFDMVDLDQLYLKAYLPEPHLGKIRRGLEAHVFTDAFPDQPFIAEVDYIASRSQFTPKEVQTKEERVKQVFALKLYLNENPEHSLSPGMPADALIRWKEDVSWRLPVQ